MRFLSVPVLVQDMINVGRGCLCISCKQLKSIECGCVNVNSDKTRYGSPLTCMAVMEIPVKLGISDNVLMRSMIDPLALEE